jgi:hypothetical protein
MLIHKFGRQIKLICQRKYIYINIFKKKQSKNAIDRTELIKFARIINVANRIYFIANLALEL